MKAILSISSQTLYGHVGNSAAQFILQRLGFEVWALPTVVLSHHPGHGKPAGTGITATQMVAHVEKLAELGKLKDCVAVQSGYLADAAQIEAVAVILQTVHQANPEAIYLCDPILGDADKGLYVAEAIADGIKSRLIDEADILTPNAFELTYLTGQAIVDADHAPVAASRLKAPLIVTTSIPRPNGNIATAAITKERTLLVETPKIQNVPNGTGDTLAALFLAETLKGADTKHALRYSVGATYELCLRSVAAGADELLLVEAQDALLGPVNLQVKHLT